MEDKTNMTELAPRESVEQLTMELADLDPKPFDNMAADNANEVARLFLDGAVNDFSGLSFSKLDGTDFEAWRLKCDVTESKILQHPSVGSNDIRHYKAYIDHCRKVSELMQTAREYRLAQDLTAKAELGSRYVDLNRELYGETDSAVARAMFEELINDSVDIKEPTIKRIRQELHDLLDPILVDKKAEGVKVSPAPDEIEYINRTVKAIFEPVLVVVDDLTKEENPNNILNDEGKVDADGVARMFETILDQVFPETGWSVERRDIVAVEVIAAEHVIAVPLKYLPKRRDQARGLAVHECVHMLRAMMGSKTNLIPLQIGMPGFLAPEEGIAGIAEKAVHDIPKVRTGYQHYITSVLVKSGCSQRQIHEIMWRYSAVDHYQEKPEVVNDKWIDRQRLGAAKYMIRGIRGAGDLSWHAMLSYYQGSHTIWSFIKRYNQDFEMTMLLFTGKIDPTDIDQRKAVWNAK